MDKQAYRALSSEGLNIFNKAKKETRGLTEAEQKRISAIETELDGLESSEPDNWLLESRGFGDRSPNDPDHRESPETRIFGKGGELRTGKFAELQQRSGVAVSHVSSRAMPDSALCANSRPRLLASTISTRASCELTLGNPPRAATMLPLE